LVLLIAALAGIAGAVRVGAQMGSVHGGSGSVAERSLHQRLDLADAAAIATVEHVEPGRIRMGGARVLAGELAETFELKRAPSHPPGLAPGERVLLMLRGERSPYLVVDRPQEVVKIADRKHEAMWGRALRALHAARGHPERLARVYEDWLGDPAAPMHRQALQGLDELARSGVFPSPALAHRLAELATDPEVHAPIRLAAARAATRSEDARLALFDRIPGGDDADVAVVSLTFGATRGERSPARTRALRRTLEHSRAEVRVAGIRSGADLQRDPDLRRLVENLAAEDPDPRIQRAARLWLQR
jgi:hypothetical protein